jgi:hypothetical protein
MEIELYAGPADGMLLEVAEDVGEFVVPAPAMTPAQFIALESGAPLPELALPILEHRYVVSPKFGRFTGKRLFIYVGARRRR